MPKEQSHTRVRKRTSLKEPRRFKVIIFNDDFTTMEFVVMVLETVFLKNHGEAESLMMAVHKGGQAVVGIYDRDTALTRVAVATEMARQAGFPLRLIYTPE